LTAREVQGPFGESPRPDTNFHAGVRGWGALWGGAV